MKIKIRRSIGDSDFEFDIEGKNEADALAKAGNLANAPNFCGICKSKDVHLSSNTSKDGFIFVKVICRACNARSQMGQYKAGGIFWKEWQKYQPLPKPPAHEEEPPEEEINA